MNVNACLYVFLARMCYTNVVRGRQRQNRSTGLYDNFIWELRVGAKYRLHSYASVFVSCVDCCRNIWRWLCFQFCMQQSHHNELLRTGSFWVLFLCSSWIIVDAPSQVYCGTFKIFFFCISSPEQSVNRWAFKWADLRKNKVKKMGNLNPELKKKECEIRSQRFLARENSSAILQCRNAVEAS